jgi:amino-acid N-acetyltransferase
MDGNLGIDDVTLRRATEEDLPAIERLLADGTLLCAGEVGRIQGVLVAEVAGTLAGSIGLEILGGDGLLRAMCVGAGRGESEVGRLLVEAELTEGALEALDAVYLFTESSQPFFARFGFLAIQRDEVPSAVLRWAEMRGGLTTGAIAMRVKLIES